MKKNRHGKAGIFTAEDIKKIRRNLIQAHHRCIFEIALYTGERMGAIVQLEVGDVYRDPANSIPHEMITFQARTRKARPDGVRETRQLPMHPELINYLAAYKPGLEGFLFPGQKRKDGSIESAHISYDAVYKFWKKLFAELGLDYRGYSTHSSRRWLITELVHNGTDLKTVQTITGHKNVEVLLSYVGVDSQMCRNALAGVTV